MRILILVFLVILFGFSFGQKKPLIITHKNSLKKNYSISSEESYRNYHTSGFFLYKAYNTKYSSLKEIISNQNPSKNNDCLPDIFDYFGFEIGLNWRLGKYNEVEIGINKHFFFYDDLSGIGPILRISGLSKFSNADFSIGQQIGIDFHHRMGNELLGYLVQFRICPTFENLSIYDKRIGVDLGLTHIAVNNL
ncbi:MAG: hypothetical protein K9J13_06950 [Saprospiraceae bacterium]|nr:hypothetical protein [Saprospiraceae bacterium]